MASKRAIIVASFPTNGKVQKPGNKALVEVEVYYNEGGPNFCTGNSETRGYYLSVTPREIQKSDTPGIQWKVSTAFSGVKDLMEPATRFNRRRLEALAATALESEQYKRCLPHVLGKNGIELVQEPAPAQ